MNGKPTTAYWIIAAAFLFWNLIGLMFYYMQVTASPETLAASLTPEQLEFVNATPAWATSAYAVAVTAGVLGAALLLLRRTVALLLFIVSLIGVLVQDLDAFVLRNVLELWGSGALILPSIVIVVCVLEIWYSHAAKARGWLV